MPFHLTPEEKQIGSDNFRAVLGATRFDQEAPARDAVTRRDFILGAAAAGTGLGAAYFGYGEIKGDKVKVAFIGTGDEGSVLINEHPTDYMEIVAVADLRPSNLDRAFEGDGNTIRRGLNKIYGVEEASKIKRFADHRELLAEMGDEIEAVVIAVPLSQHAPVAIDCLKAGKHVLCEKLMARTITECKEMIRTARDGSLNGTGRRLLLAVGHQRHYSVLYDNANFLIDQGMLGEIKHIRASWHRNNSFLGYDGWRKAIPLIDQKKLTEERCEEFGYDSLNQLVNWRLFDKTGAGLMAELGSHQLDACSIFLDKRQPLAVQGFGGKNYYGVPGLGPEELQKDDRQIDDHVYTTFEFPGPAFDAELYKKDPKAANDIVVVTYSSINTNSSEPYGEVVFGNRGTLMLLKEKETYLSKEAVPTDTGSGFDQRLYVMSNKDAKPVLASSESLGPAQAVEVADDAIGEDISRGYTEEMEHFCYCIVEGRDGIPEDDKKLPKERRLRCDGIVAMKDAIMALTSNIAMDNMERITFQDAWFDYKSDEVPEVLRKTDRWT